MLRASFYTYKSGEWYVKCTSNGFSSRKEAQKFLEPLMRQKLFKVGIDLFGEKVSWSKLEEMTRANCVGRYGAPIVAWNID